MTSIGGAPGETQIPCGVDNKKSKGKMQIPYGNDNKKSKCKS